MAFLGADAFQALSRPIVARPLFSSVAEVINIHTRVSAGARLVSGGSPAPVTSCPPGRTLLASKAIEPKHRMVALIQRLLYAHTELSNKIISRVPSRGVTVTTSTSMDVISLRSGHR